MRDLLAPKRFRIVKIGSDYYPEYRGFFGLWYKFVSTSGTEVCFKYMENAERFIFNQKEKVYPTVVKYID